MKKGGVIFIVCIVLLTIVIISVKTIKSITHPFANCDSFAGGVRSGWTSYVDGYSSGTIITFIDTNENQVFDDGENLLPFVSGKRNEANFITDRDGKYTTWIFKPGCCNGCWNDSYFSLFVPLGYKPTTKIHFDFTGNDLIYYAGFIQSSSIDYPQNIIDYPWIIAFINKGLQIQSFTFSSTGELFLEINPNISKPSINLTDNEEMREFISYYVFNVADGINYEAPLIKQIKINLITTRETFSCIFTDYRWTTITPGDSVSNKYCEVPNY